MITCVIIDVSDVSDVNLGFCFDLTILFEGSLSLDAVGDDDDLAMDQVVQQPCS